jgi:hypothetical protein
VVNLSIVLFAEGRVVSRVAEGQSWGLGNCGDESCKAENFVSGIVLNVGATGRWTKLGKRIIGDGPGEL